MYEVDFERLDGDQIRRIIKLTSTFEEITNARICEDIESIGGPIVRPNSISKRKYFPKGFGEKLQSIVDDLESGERDLIYKNISALPGSDIDEKYKSVGGRLAYSLDQWLNLDEVSVNRFAADCANENGRYIIFRSPDGIKLLSARMNIIWKPRSNLLTPGFVTVRYNQGKPEKITRGQAFAVGESIYTFGRVKRDTALRITRLRRVPRIQRTDLYGLRLGTSSVTERPYAHLVYAYQIKRSRGDALNRLLACEELNDPFLDEEIVNMSQIRRLLTADGLNENGLMTRQLDER